MQHRPFLKWAGNKYRLVPRIIKLLPNSDTLIEPFAGSGAVFLNTNYKNYIINDINPDLINLYQFIQTEQLDFIKLLKKYFAEKYNHPDKYYELRKQFNSTKNKKLKSILFLYLNRHGYNGLCRYNLQGKYNVPFGRYKKPYFPEIELEFFCEKSQGVKFTNLCFTDVFKNIPNKSIIYCDPPYIPLSNTASFTAYAKNQFNLNHQYELAQLARQCKHPVLISNHDTPLTKRIYFDSEYKTFKVPRFISANPHTRRPVRECLALFD